VTTTQREVVIADAAPLANALRRNSSRCNHLCNVWDHLAYVDGQRVEYYSKSNSMWLYGDVCAEISKKTGKPMYSVSVRGSGQRRRGITFEFLRFPLQEGEPCEVFSMRDEWWVSATVLGSSTGIVPAYEVQINDALDGETTVSMVSAALVRRSFPAGSRLLVYRDASRGWVDAVALEPGQEDIDEEQPQSWAPEDGPFGGNSMLDFGGALEGPTLSTLSQATICPSGIPKAKGPKKADGSSLDCWFMVPIREGPKALMEVAANDTTDRELVPSYLVRVNPLYLEETRASAIVRQSLLMESLEEQEISARANSRQAPLRQDAKDDGEETQEVPHPQDIRGGSGPWWACFACN